MSGAISAEELVAALGSRFGAGVEVVTREPYRYATSAPLERVRVRTADGTEADLILKDLARERLLGDARVSKPEHIWDPRRELETYRRILSPGGIGPRCLATAGGSRPWLLIEKVPGVELWQVGELEVWEQVATWLAGFHARFAGRVEELREANPHLLELSEPWFSSWCERAREALTRSSDERAGELLDSLAGYESWARELARLPRTLVHGELYPSNVIVASAADAVRVCPVDWEMSGLGPAAIDLAALVGGWDVANRERLVSAYDEALAAAGAGVAGVSTRSLTLARLHLALQWLGWSRDWRPPREHSHDWIGEALAMARAPELGKPA